MPGKSNWQRLCASAELRHAQCREFELTVDSGATSAAFVVNWQGEFYAYLNSCPHTGISMNWAPNQFFDIENRFLHCGLHGALFEPANGFCVRGPCLGQSLKACEIRLENGQILVKTTL